MARTFTRRQAARVVAGGAIALAGISCTKTHRVMGAVSDAARKYPTPVNSSSIPLELMITQGGSYSTFYAPAGFELAGHRWEAALVRHGSAWLPGEWVVAFKDGLFSLVQARENEPNVLGGIHTVAKNARPHATKEV